MPHPDEPTQWRTRGALAPTAGASDRPEGVPPTPSKTQRKAEMHAKQDVGKALVALEPARFRELATEFGLPETLVLAIGEANRVKTHEGRRRQMQYVGKLMREVETDAIAGRLAALASGQGREVARAHALERWRDRLLADPDALDALAADYPSLDRPRFRSLIAKAQSERSRNLPPHAYRAIFRALETLAPPAREPDAAPPA